METRRSPGTVGSSFERVLEQAGFPRAATATRAAAEMPPPSLGEGLGEDEPTWTEHGLTSTWTCTSSRGGRDRITAWTSFVKPVLAMPNLTIKDNTIVTKVLIEEGRVVGIEVIERDRGWRLRDRMRQLRFAAATTEVVLCGGVFRTAKLLMLSGIGPKQHLEDKSVAVVVDSPHVSRYLAVQSLELRPRDSAVHRRHDMTRFSRRLALTLLIRHISIVYVLFRVPRISMLLDGIRIIAETFPTTH